MRQDKPEMHIGKYDSKVKTPVLLEFFNRPETFRLVFEQIKIARPETLFLYQDGIRAGRGDEEGHAECRKIAEEIDWNCKVYRWYQKENKGCDPSGYLAQRWAFSNVDECIVLEDDCVPSQSFFTFCEEMLERYKDDERINIICGMNNMGIWEKCQDSYFFGRRGSICGWASWSRVVMDWKEDYDWITDAAYLKRLEKTWKPCRCWNEILKRHKYCATTGKQYFEVFLCERMLRTDSLNIIPKKNMICNIGMLRGTHSDMELKMYPRFYRKWFEMETYEIEVPMKHPEKVVQNVEFDRAMDPNWFQQKMLRPERIWLQIRYGNGHILINKAYNKILKLIGLKK